MEIINGNLLAGIVSTTYKAAAHSFGLRLFFMQNKIVDISYHPAKIHVNSINKGEISVLSFLLTVYTIAGLSVMAFIVVNIAFENKFTKFQIKCMKIFPIHTLVIFTVCVISYSAYYYIEKITKR